MSIVRSLQSKILSLSLPIEIFEAAYSLQFIIIYVASERTNIHVLFTLLFAVGSDISILRPPVMICNSKWAKIDHNTGNYAPFSFQIVCGFFMSHRVKCEQGLWEGTCGLWSLSKKTRKSNHLQMSLQRQHFLLAYFKTLCAGPARVWTHNHSAGRLSTNVPINEQMQLFTDTHGFCFLDVDPETHFQWQVTVCR